VIFKTLDVVVMCVKLGQRNLKWVMRLSYYCSRRQALNLMAI